MRYSGMLGIVRQTETSPGVWEETITEVPTLGIVKQTTETLAGVGEILPRHSTTTSVSVFAREVGSPDNSMIRYVTHKGKRWQATSIVDDPPLIVIYFGEEYHGPAPQ
jgi:hypothetical protein